MTDTISREAVLEAIEDMRKLAEESAATPGAICDTLKGWVESIPPLTGEVEGALEPMATGWLGRTMEEAEWYMSLFDPGTLKFKADVLKAIEQVRPRARQALKESSHE